MKNIDEELEILSQEKDAITSSIALNKILHNLLIESRKEKTRLWVIILLLIAVIISEAIGFFCYESQFDVEKSTETTYTYSEASGENSAINNVQGDQYNDQAIKNNYDEEES